MQTELYDDGTVRRSIFSRPTDEELRQKLKDEYQRAKDAGAIEIQQVVMDPELPCPCGSKRKTKNCCLKRYRSIMANAGLPVPIDDA
jgi:hypothetical protein